MAGGHSRNRSRGPSLAARQGRRSKKPGLAGDPTLRGSRSSAAPHPLVWLPTPLRGANREILVLVLARVRPICTPRTNPVADGRSRLWDVRCRPFQKGREPT